MFTPDHYTTVTVTGSDGDIAALIRTYGETLIEYAAPFISTGDGIDLEWKIPPQVSVETRPDGTVQHRVFSRVRVIAA